MIRRQRDNTELSFDSLTDMMTNMMGLILLMVAIASIVSGGMRINLIDRLADPGDRTPIYLVCTHDQVLFMHHDSRWQEELSSICQQMKTDLGRKPTTSEALREANRVGLRQSPDLDPTFVREIAREQGRELYLIGVRFLPRADAPGFIARPHRADDREPEFSPAALKALDQADPATEYIDAFVYEDAFDALQALQRRAKELQLQFGWRPLLANQNPGLSEHGERGQIGGNQ